MNMAALYALLRVLCASVVNTDHPAYPVEKFPVEPLDAIRGETRIGVHKQAARKRIVSVEAG
jgi:hypothetical protein